jgi:hypothetical protein
VTTAAGTTAGETGRLFLDGGLLADEENVGQDKDVDVCLAGGRRVFQFDRRRLQD